MATPAMTIAPEAVPMAVIVPSRPIHRPTYPECTRPRTIANGMARMAAVPAPWIDLLAIRNGEL